ncbi:MAG: FAD binding domain-containing protein [Thermotogae bacterium]|nr:FAD binding domain-containing protein [Thermotogota bacterium]
MLKIKEYIKPKTLEEAYEIGSLPYSLYVGGGLVVAGIESDRIERLVDLKSVGLDEIEDAEEVKIGANVTLSAFTDHLFFSTLYNGFFSKTARYIGSTQIRNMATVGGSIAARFGWSDVLTILMISNARIESYDGDLQEYPIERYIEEKKRNSIITAIYLPKGDRSFAFEKFARSTFDIALLNLGISLSLVDGKCKDAIVAVGARPMRARRITEVEEFLEGRDILKSIDEGANLIADVVDMKKDMRASAEYRKALAGALLKKAMRRICYESGIQC